MKLFFGFAMVERNLIFLAIATHAHNNLSGKRIHNRNAYTVQAAGNLITFAAEFTTCMEDGEYNLDGWDFFLGVLVYGNAAAIVDNGDGVVLMDGNLNVVTIASKSFIYCVVYNLVHQMVKAARTGRTDIHTRALAHCFKAFQDLNVLAAVVGFV